MSLSLQLIQIPDTETVTKREYYPEGDLFEIGRDFDADICLPDMSGKMSRRHLRLTRQGVVYSVIDISSNGAELNNTSMPRNEPQVLRDGDVLSFAGYKILLGIFKDLAPEPQPAMNSERPKPQAVFSAIRRANGEAEMEPMLANEDVEEMSAEPERGFSETVVDLDEDLMFDPFADGPELRENNEAQRQFKKTTSGYFEDYEEHEAETIEATPTSGRTALPRPYRGTSELDARLRGFTYQEHALKAVEKALDRFLDEVDPNLLEDDYKEFIPRLLQRKKRYWGIHRRQFSKKKTSGEYRRMFLALFAEEMRKQ
ncbi:type VI secretion system FHA domain protein [Tritonibacter multivorans]|uniref:Type VI secretion system FHA domain protein n=2 Tax=Tritonibacter multivorans TaxID=928856 RepID=A0A0P1GA23_9RHOB|nr:type VI secretion system FHA domain protein [Tritonibacter multivorans]SFD15984.1 FHA domain protein [Tritonibacter multivorans]